MNRRLYVRRFWHRETILLPAMTFLISCTVAGCSGAYVSPESYSASGLTSQRAPHPKVGKSAYKKALYVGEPSTDSIKIFTNTYYHELGVITNGISYPFSMSMDQSGNLYVANNLGGDVTEYAPGSTSPSFTYSTNMIQPQGVTVDRYGNVYEADANGYINQYFQGFNTPTKSCPAPVLYTVPMGLAVDAQGDVFAAYEGGGGLYEFQGGLAGCTATHLSALGSSFAWDLVLDSNDDLIVSVGEGIDVIDPPYSSVTRTFGSSNQFFGMSLNEKNKLLFASGRAYSGDYGVVFVFNYKTGEIIKTLGVSHGLSGAEDVVDGPNAVY